MGRTDAFVDLSSASVFRAEFSRIREEMLAYEFRYAIVNV
jgi:hypothetical protein